MTFVKISSLYPDDLSGEYICLETGEVIGQLEYIEYISATYLDHVADIPALIQPLPNLLSEFVKAEEALASLAMALASEIPLLPDVNPDLEVGETGTTPMTYGSVENTIHPIFSDVEDWKPFPDLSFLIDQFSWLVNLLKQKILKGSKISKTRVQNISTYRDFAVKGFIPLRDPGQLNSEFRTVKDRFFKNKIDRLERISRSLAKQKLALNRTIENLQSDIHDLEFGISAFCRRSEEEIHLYTLRQ